LCRSDAEPSRALALCAGCSDVPVGIEALLRHRAGGDVEVVSAGSHPKRRIDPDAVRVLREHYGGIAPAVPAMFVRASQMTSSTRQSWGSRRSLASAARRHSSSVTVTSVRWDANLALTARASG
jgi:hypothetical protein